MVKGFFISIYSFAPRFFVQARNPIARRLAAAHRAPRVLEGAPRPRRRSRASARRMSRLFPSQGGRRPPERHACAVRRDPEPCPGAISTRVSVLERRQSAGCRIGEFALSLWDRILNEGVDASARRAVLTPQHSLKPPNWRRDPRSRRAPPRAPPGCGWQRRACR